MQLFEEMQQAFEHNQKEANVKNSNYQHLIYSISLQDKTLT